MSLQALAIAADALDRSCTDHRMFPQSLSDLTVYGAGTLPSGPKTETVIAITGLATTSVPSAVAP